MKLRNITSVFVMAAIAGAAYAIPDSSLIYMTGGGGSVKPAATNAVLEAAMAYTDSAITNAIYYVDWEMGCALNDGVTNYFPNTKSYQTISNNVCYFTVASDPSVKADCMFEVYSPVDSPVYVASTEGVEGREFSLVFTTSVIGQPIDFKLIVTLMPYEGVPGTASRLVVFNLRRTF